jgi:hypothetical protein
MYSSLLYMKDDRKTIEKVLKVIIGLNIVSIIVSILSLIGR